MPLSQEQIQAMDKTSGLSSKDVSDMDAISGIGQKETNFSSENPLVSFGKKIVEPIKRFGQFGAEAIGQAGLMAVSPEMRRASFPKVFGKATEQDLMTIGNLEKPTYFTDKEKIKDKKSILEEGVKSTAGAGAFAVPGVGAGGSVGKAALLGAGSGALSGFAESERGKELQGTTLGAAFGGITGGILQKGGKVLSKLGKPSKIIPKEKEVSNVAAKTYANIFQIPKNRKTQGLNPVNTSKELIRMDIYPNSLDDLVEKSNIVTGSNGELPKVVRKVLDKIPGEVDISDAPKKAEIALRGKLGFDQKEVDDVTRSIVNSLPVGKEINKANALDAFDLERQLQAQAVLYKKSFERIGDPKYKALSDAYGAAYQHVADVLDRDTKKFSLIDGVKDPETISKLREVSPILADDFVNAKTIRDLRSLQKPFVDAMMMAAETSDQATRIFTQSIMRGAQASAGAVAGSMLAGPLGALAGGIVAPAVEPVLSGISQAVRVPATTQASRLMGSFANRGLPSNLIKKPIEQAGSTLLSPFISKPVTYGAGRVGSELSK